MNELLDILNEMNVVLPDEKLTADELLWWIVGYKACMDQVNMIAEMIGKQSGNAVTETDVVTFGENRRAE